MKKRMHAAGLGLFLAASCVSAQLPARKQTPEKPRKPSIEHVEVPFPKPDLAGNPAALLPALTRAPSPRPSGTPPMQPDTAPKEQPAPLENFALPELPSWLQNIAPPVPLQREVKKFCFQNNTVFSERELNEVVIAFLKERFPEKKKSHPDPLFLSNDDLEDIRGALTRHYTDHKYETSGALLVAPTDKDGVVTFRIVEGKLSRITWNNRGQLRQSYLDGQLSDSLKGVLNTDSLRDQLQLLQRNPNIRQIQATLKPGLRPGEAFLDANLALRPWYYGGVELHNRRSPSIGSEQITTWFGMRSLTGHSDNLELRMGLLQRGIDDIKLFNGNDLFGQYNIKLPWWKTQVELLAQKNSYAVVEDSLAPLGIQGSSEMLRGTLRWSLIQSTSSEFATGLSLDYRHSSTKVLGVPFTITPGAVNGVSEQLAVRWFQEYISRSMNHVLALRNTFSKGFSGTDDGTARDADFFSWSASGQWMYRPFRNDIQIVCRSAAQWTKDPLLSLEQISLGGSTTVRGYREHQLVRDLGGFLSAELRIPVWPGGSGGLSCYLAPFLDYGAGWQLAQQSSGKWQPKDRTWLGSAGVGLLVRYHKCAELQIYWGYALNEVRRGPRTDPQDSGIHFSAKWTCF